ncbi:MAG: reverse transcriptase/maturase family protein [bacterium]|nr:reverse transcriptase/maturase family protein [bacterium]
MVAWQEFLKGKRGKKDVQEFGFNLMDNILSLHGELASQRYRHGGYYQFRIADPKPRIIHKAEVRDRLVHHAIHRLLYPFFDKTFFADSFSCRIKKGTHRALNRFRAIAYKVSKNHTKTCWVLKCDIKKFFDSINHQILLKILKAYIPDQKIIWLLENVISSFSTKPGFGLPLGNLTSQLFANVYMNQFDQFVKHKLKARHYVRYADDFVFLSPDKERLVEIIPKIQDFLEENLKLFIHKDKLFLKTLVSGVDFLGWVHFPDHRVIRFVTKWKMFRRLKENPNEQSRQSYLGMLGHGNANKIKARLNLLLPSTEVPIFRSDWFEEHLGGGWAWFVRLYNRTNNRRERRKLFRRRKVILFPRSCLAERCRVFCNQKPLR